MAGDRLYNPLQEIPLNQQPWRVDQENTDPGAVVEREETGGFHPTSSGQRIEGWFQDGAADVENRWPTSPPARLERLHPPETTAKRIHFGFAVAPLRRTVSHRRKYVILRQRENLPQQPLKSAVSSEETRKQSHQPAIRSAYRTSFMLMHPGRG